MTASEKYLAEVKARAATATFSDGSTVVTDGGLQWLIGRIRRSIRDPFTVELLNSEKADVIQVIEQHRHPRTDVERLFAMIGLLKKQRDLAITEFACVGSASIEDKKAERAEMVADADAELDRLATSGGAA